MGLPVQRPKETILIIIGDVHGCYKTLLALLAKCPGDDLCFVGDFIDRGPESKKVVEFIRQNNFSCVLGNHEDLMIQCLEKGDPSWYHPQNGGETTLQNYGIHPRQVNSPSKHAPQGLSCHPDYLWIKSLPLYLEFPEIKSQNGRHLVVSHSSVAGYWHKRDHPDRAALKEHFLWARPEIIEDVAQIYNVFGHTPVSEPIVRRGYANIDTGCVYTNKINYGKLSALQFPQMKIFTQMNVD